MVEPLEFENTSALIDRELDLACAMLKAGISNKIFDFAIVIFQCKCPTMTVKILIKPV